MKRHSVVTTASQRFRMLAMRRFGHCQWCNARLTYDSSTLDHRVPVALGGRDELSNYVLACGPCNNGRPCVPDPGPVLFGPPSWVGVIEWADAEPSARVVPPRTRADFSREYVLFRQGKPVFRGPLEVAQRQMAQLERLDLPGPLEIVPAQEAFPEEFVS